MTKRRDIEKHLKENGFKFYKQGGRHPFWIKDGTKIMTPNGSKVSDTVYKWIIVQVKRANKGMKIYSKDQSKLENMK